MEEHLARPAPQPLACPGGAPASTPRPAATRCRQKYGAGASRRPRRPLHPRDCSHPVSILAHSVAFCASEFAPWPGWRARQRLMAAQGCLAWRLKVPRVSTSSANVSRYPNKYRLARSLLCWAWRACSCRSPFLRALVSHNPFLQLLPVSHRVPTGPSKPQAPARFQSLPVRPPRGVTTCRSSSKR